MRKTATIHHRRTQRSPLIGQKKAERRNAAQGNHLCFACKQGRRGVLLCLSEVLFDFLSIHGRDPWGERVRVGRPDSWDMSSECNMRVGGK